MAALALFTVRPACATEGGGSVYPYGLNTVASGVLPKPGPYLYSYNSYYTADTTTTNDGEPAPIPFEVDVRVHTLRYLQVLESARLFGGGVGWLVAQPYLIGDANIGPREDYRTGVGDTTVGLMLGWHRPQLHSMTGVDVTLPTGSYSTEHLFNAGRNQYAATFYYAVTAPLGERLDANLRTNLTVNGTNPDTDYHSGMEAGVEYSLNLRLAKGWLAGINGYLYQQITDDEIDGDPVGGRWPQAARARVRAAARSTGVNAGVPWRSGSTRTTRATRPKATSTGCSCSSRYERAGWPQRRATKIRPNAPRFMSSA